MTVQIILTDLPLVNGGAGGAGSLSGTASPGMAGTEFDGSHGAGGGGGGCGYSGNLVVVHGGAGGLYGGGGGGAASKNSQPGAISGAGGNGLIIIRYVSTQSLLPVGPLYLTVGSGSWSVPSDWNSANNSVECIGAGGSGGACLKSSTIFGPTGTATGAGGGAYSKETNITLTPGGTAAYNVGAGGAAITNITSGTVQNGNAGTDTWFNGASFGIASVGAKGGSAGGGANGSGGSNPPSSYIPASPGGSAAQGIGSTLWSGGNGGESQNCLEVQAATGGGGAAGPNGPGESGVSTYNDDALVGTNGGGADLMNFWTVPSDFDPDNNSIGCIGGGGAGAGSGCNVQDFGAAGGGGGAYAQANNVPLTPGQTVPYFIGAGGFAYTALAPDVIHNQTRHLGASGGDTFLLSPTLVLAKGGSGGGAWQQRIQLIPPPAIPGGAGGNTGSIGDLIYAGGRGGEVENTIGPGNGNIGTGGGGGAGPLGPGTNGGDSPGGASPPSTTVGGDGDGGGGGIGGTAGDGVGTAAGNGANGTELGTQGAGGGGGGNRSNGNSGVVTAGNAGLYGAGSGGCSVFTFQLAVVGAGSQGAIIVTYDAVAPPPPPVIPPAGFIIERLDNRVWPTVENCWCVDCGFTLARPTPDANLIASSAVGSGIPTGVTDLVGGQGYSSATTAELVDGNGLGPGAGALVNLTIVSGVITAIAFSPAGSGYVFPNLVFNDPENTGSGASATVTLDNSVTFVASAAVFSSGDVGSVIRAGYGVAEITSFVDTQTVIAQMISPIVRVQPDDPINTDQVITQLSGSWTMTEPISSFYLPQLIGFEITGLADGQVIPPTIVPADGIVTLAKPASAIIVGLGFQAQLQSTYLDAGEPTVQGQRKKVAEVTVRIEQSAAFEIGGNQPDGSVQSPQQLAPEWQNMVPAPTHAIAPFNSPATPLFTGDVRVPIPSGFNTRGQVAVQQLNPLPLQVLDYVPEILSGDKPAQEAPQRRGKGDK